MKQNNEYSVWFVTGSQHLYGKETLDKVESNSRQIASELNHKIQAPVSVIFKPVLTSDDAIFQLLQEANTDATCIGLICWMHTFSPAQMWIRGLSILNKPYLHLHTQFNRDIPWNEIDMNFMNLNQSAHGDREFGYICSRMKHDRAVVVGHWQDAEVKEELEIWARAAMGWHESGKLRVARFGDNMRNVAVTEGNKVSARIQFGWSVAGYGVGELVSYVNAVSDNDISNLMKEYSGTYNLDSAIMNNGEQKEKLAYAARIEIGLERFLQDGGFGAFTTTFEDLHGLKQLPGLAVQRLMQKGYGFGAEGDWKTAALLRCMKVMGQGLEGGTSFMEDYTYHLEPGNMKVLGAHMLEVCPSIAGSKPSVEVHPLSIGGKDDPARLVFAAGQGSALNATLLDMGDRFRLLVNTVETVTPPELPKLPVARALWIPQPNLKVAATAWILAGGAHHTGFSYSVKPAHLKHFAAMAGTEYLVIDEKTNLDDFRNTLRWNDLYYQFNRK
jgi:L-arabinose isomerase